MAETNGNKYAAITIGPIYDTISLTSSPAGLWAASYLFSHISRRLCELIVEKGLADGGGAEEKERNIISPFFSAGEELLKKKNGIGLFHDRIVFKPKAPEKVLEQLQELFKVVVEEISQAFYDGGKSPKGTGGCTFACKEKLHEWFKQYLQLHGVLFEVEGEGKENPLLKCSQYLDAMELEKTFPTVRCPISSESGTNASNPLNALFEGKEKNALIRRIIRDSFSEGEWPFIINNAGKADANNVEALAEGGTSADGDKAPGREGASPNNDKAPGREGASPNNDEAPDKEGKPADDDKTPAEGGVSADGDKMPTMKNIIVDSMEKLYKGQKIQSYYAIVQSDGDNFGKYIQNMLDPRDFSKKCLDFCSQAAEKIQHYGGIPIYAGGDDLLFIAQPASPTCKGQTLLDLLGELKNLFETEFTEDAQGKQPTISFGVAICYYKYPLYEAFDESHAMLFEHAKKNRNAAAISLQKRSGRAAKFVLEDFNNTQVTNQLIAMIKKHVDENVLKSIQKHIWEQQSLFLEALSLYKNHENDQALKNVFANAFDSEMHQEKSGDIDDALKLLKEIAKADCGKWLLAVGEPGAPNTHLSGEENGISSLQLLKVFDALLRFIKFYGEKADEEADGEAAEKADGKTTEEGDEKFA